MKRFIILLLFLFTIHFLEAQTLKEKQLKNSRVKVAYKEKEIELKEYAKQKGFTNLSNSILIIAYKKEQILEVWIKSKKKKTFELFKEYTICTTSGTLGAKRKEGDGQIPEGFYVVKSFNPNSVFYLSLEINYPNKSDRILGDKKHLGGDIFIHGNCCSIGCIPITDEKIKELYVLAVEATNNSNIPVYIFPARLDTINIGILKRQYPNNAEFWENLKIGYDVFQKNKQMLSISVEKNGKYKIK